MSNQITRLFEWDEKKNEINFKKHRIRFEEVKEVFDDPFAVVRQDRIENGEERWQTIGMTKNLVVVLVAHTLRYEDCEIIRIISARKLDKKERRIYEHS